MARNSKEIYSNQSKDDSRKIQRVHRDQGAKNGLPDFVYDATVVSENDKNQAKEMIKELKEKILSISELNSVGSPNVFIPFRESIEKSLPADKASDMTTAQRLYNYM